MMGHPSYRPLILIRTWSGSYAPLWRLPSVLFGWFGELLGKVWRR